MLGNKEVMSRNIERYMKKKGVTRRRMSEDLKISYTTLTDWINAKTYPRIDKIELMANYFGISKADLVENFIDVQPTNLHTIPILSSVSAGQPMYAEENIIEKIYVGEPIVKNGREYFGLIITGDSMDKEFNEGDVVIVDKEAQIENGQIGVVQVNGYKATVKQVRFKDDHIILIPRSNNPIHEPQFYTEDDEITFLGKVIGMNRKY